MAIDAASSAVFVQGSGVDAATLQATVVSVAAVGVLLWLAWTAFALWRDWRDGSLGLMDPMGSDAGGGARSAADLSDPVRRLASSR